MKHFTWVIYLNLLIFLLNSNLIQANVVINEIMYNPSGSDSGHEWIEIYSDESIDLTGWKFYEANSNHGLTLINGNWILDGFAIIADEWDTFLLDYPDFNSTLFDSSWSSLSNSGEYLAIRNKSLDIVDSVNYSVIFANGNGRSLERFNYGWNESGTIGGTPGEQNNDTQSMASQLSGLKLTVAVDEFAYVGIIYTTLFKIENLDHIAGITDNIDVTIGYNISSDFGFFIQNTTVITGLNSFKSSNTGYFNPSAVGNYTISGWIISSTVNDTNKDDDSDSDVVEVIDVTNILCNISVNITADNLTYIEGEKIKFFNTLNNETYPYVIEYWIEDYFGNYYKNKINTTNTNQKTWTTNIIEKDRVLFIHSIVYPLCNDTERQDNSKELMFIVKSDPTENTGSVDASTLEIVDVENSLEFGDLVNVKINVYKGNTNKYALKLYIENKNDRVSENTKFHIYDKFSNFNGQLSVELKPNCNLKYEKGDYDLVLEGLDDKVKEEIKISGYDNKFCSDASLNSIDDMKSSQKGFDYEIIDYPQKITSSNVIDTQVKITNNQETVVVADVWSYIYRGSKSYSGDREQNKKHISLEAETSAIITLTNTLVDDMENGEYKLKVLINKDNQKTNREIIKDIDVLSGINKKSKCPNDKSNNIKLTNSRPKNLAEYNIINQMLCLDNVHYEKMIYESNNERIKKLIVYFMLAAFALLAISLVVKK